MMKILLILASLSLSLSIHAAETTHSFLGVGKANKAVIIGEDGKILWKYDQPASDGWVLPNGNVLLALYPTEAYPSGGVVELEHPSNKVVFSYKATQKEVSTVLKRKNGNYLLTELGPNPRAVEVNPEGMIVHTTPFDCQKQNTHMQVRMLRILPNGNLIAPHLLDFAVKEYDSKTGKVVNVIKTDTRGRDIHDWPFTAIRLENGHTVIGLTHGNRVVETDPAGKIIWSVTNEDLGSKLIADCCGVQRLPNGNTVMVSYRARDVGIPKLIEVNRAKEIVWTYTGLPRGFHHIQILTTNGKPLADNSMR